MRGKGYRRVSDASYAYLLIIPLIIFELGLTVYPLVYSFWTSLHNTNLAANTDKYVGLANYIHVFTSSATLNSLQLSLVFMITVVISSVLLGIGIALLLNEEFVGRGLVRALVLLPWAIAEYSCAIMWSGIYNQSYGFLNGLLMQLGIIREYTSFVTPAYAIYAVAIAYTWHYTPLGAFFFLGSLQAVPQDLYSQAKIDGAKVFRRFWVVTRPFMRHSFMIVAILSVVQALQALDLVFVMTFGGPGVATQVLPYLVYRETFATMSLGLGASLAWTLSALIIALTTVLFVLLTRRR